MEWVIFLILIIVTAVAAFRQGEKSRTPIVRSILQAHAHDRMNYLAALRRELANFLVWQDPDRYARLYELIHLEITPLKELDAASREARLAKLCEKYPHYQDFDLVGTRDYVLYADTLGADLDGIEERYRDIATFQALLIATDKHWKYFHATDASELDHLKEYVQNIKDTQLQQRLQQAIRERYIWEAGKEAAESAEFDWPDWSVRRVSHYAENRFGIHDKRTNQFGLYGFFIADDGRTFRSWYRSDPSFEQEEHLEVLSGVLKATP